MTIKEIKDLLIDTLTPLGYGTPRLQGSYREDESYPESFITFFIVDSPELAFYNNKSNSTAFYLDVNFYSSDPDLVNTVPGAISEKLEQVGFIKQGKGTDLVSDYPTHTGWNLGFIYQEKLIIKEEK